MSVTEFRKAVSRCSFLLDWQKEQLLGMLDDVGDGGNGHVVHTEDVLPVVDNVLWRTMGAGLNSLPVGDMLSVERAVREVTRLR